MPAQSEYNDRYHDNWAWSLAAKGATDKDIADAFEISVRTLNRWKQMHPSFAKALTVGKESADANVEASLYKRAIGYTAEESEKIVEVDKDGNTKPVRVKSTTKHIAPDTMAIMYWLNNRKRRTGEWAQSQKIELSGNVGQVDLSRLSDDELKAIAKAAAENGNEIN